MKWGIPLVGILIVTIVSLFRLITDGQTLSVLIATIAVLLLMVGISSFYMVQFYNETLKKRRYQLLFWCFVLIGYVPSVFLVGISPYLLTVLLTAAFITSMIHVRLGFILNFVMLTLLLITTGLGLDTYLMYLLAGSFICLTIPYAKNRHQVMYVAGSNMVFFMLVNVVSYLMIHDSLLDFDYMSLLFSAVNGLFVVIFTVGTEPIWEMLFRITSDARLIELSNSNQPLLKKLLVEAPGTYHHSMLVANLAEKGALEIGANYHLARVGSLYHDIGKTRDPGYFTENQEGDNLHDSLSPDASAAYIKRHVTDGLELAKEFHLPKSIQDIIVEHQGDAIISYFYQKALDHSDGFEINDMDYRYPGPKPQTKESAIVMLADCVEAAVKGLGQNGRDIKEIIKLIDKVFGTVISKKQLDDCPLTFNELPLIKEAFVTVYKGMYHDRVSYERK